MNNSKVDKKFIKRTTLIECISWLKFCKDFVIKHYPSVYVEYKQFIDTADDLIFKIKVKKHITSSEFSEINDWFCCYANGLNGFNFESILLNDYYELMNFTTNYCFAYSDVDNETIYFYIKS